MPPRGSSAPFNPSSALEAIPQRTFEDLWQELANQVVSLEGSSQLLEVENDYCIFQCSNGKLYQIGYKASPETVELVGQPTEVTEVKVYRPVQDQVMSEAGATKNSVPMFKKGVDITELQRNQRLEYPNRPIRNSKEEPLPLPVMNFDDHGRQAGTAAKRTSQSQRSGGQDALPLPATW